MLGGVTDLVVGRILGVLIVFVDIVVVVDATALV